METERHIYRSKWTISSSYPTYEEWKQRLTTSSVTGNALRSYPTYEEWKQTSAFIMENIRL